MVVEAVNGVFQIDDEEFERISRYHWRLNDFGYPCANHQTDGRSHTLRLHHYLFGKAPEGFVWDHINRDKSDNRRQNLRITTQQVNQRNRNLASNNTSGVTGVTRNRNLWKAQICIDYQTIALGRFAAMDDAIKARKEAEDLYWGEER